VADDLVSGNGVRQRLPASIARRHEAELCVVHAADEHPDAAHRVVCRIVGALALDVREHLGAVADAERSRRAVEAGRLEMPE
jgi:hypothetical protein